MIFFVILISFINTYTWLISRKNFSSLDTNTIQHLILFNIIPFIILNEIYSLLITVIIISIASLSTYRFEIYFSKLTQKDKDDIKRQSKFFKQKLSHLVNQKAVCIEGIAEIGSVQIDSKTYAATSDEIIHPNDFVIIKDIDCFLIKGKNPQKEYLLIRCHVEKENK